MTECRSHARHCGRCATDGGPLGRALGPLLRRGAPIMHLAGSLLALACATGAPGESAEPDAICPGGAVSDYCVSQWAGTCPDATAVREYCDEANEGNSEGLFRTESCEDDVVALFCPISEAGTRWYFDKEGQLVGVDILEDYTTPGCSATSPATYGDVTWNCE